MAAFHPLGRKAVVLLDLVLLVWLGGWVVVALITAGEIRKLERISDSLERGGAALVQTGEGLQTLDAIPFGIGDRIARTGRQIAVAGREGIVSSRSSREAIDNLVVLLGWSIAVVPTVPLIALYAPWRAGRWREVRSIRRVLKSAERSDPSFLEFLARRAVQNLPYYRLREITPNPWDDLDERRHQDLATAELKRLGLRMRFAPATGGGLTPPSRREP